MPTPSSTDAVFNLERLHTQRTMLQMSIVSLIVILSFAPFTYRATQDLSTIFSFISFGILLLLFSVSIGRSTKLPITVIAHIYLTISGIGYAAIAITHGGVFAAAYYFNIFLPIISIHTLGQKRGKLWFLISFLLCIAIFTYNILAEITLQDRHLTKKPVGMFLLIILSTTFSAFMTIRNYRRYQRLLQIAKTAQMELDEAKQRAELATSTKSNFLANMSHEIRTPMNGILGMIYLVKNIDPKELSNNPALFDEQRQHLDIIERSATALITILDDIRDFSKMQSGTFVLDHIDNKPFALTELVQDTCRLLKSVADQKKIGLHVAIDANIPPWVVGDAVRIRQILSNILSNAVKFTTTGYVTIQVVLDPPALSAAASSREDSVFSVTFSIEDTGIGISEDALGRLFQPFVQAEVSTTRQFGGTGLGLTISKKLVEMMHGSLTVQSTLGQGSVFVVRLPFIAAAPSAVSTHIDDDKSATMPKQHEILVHSAPQISTATTSQPAIAPLPAHIAAPIDSKTFAKPSKMFDGIDASNNPRILIVEDNDVNQLIAKRMLQNMGCDVFVVDNGALALDALRQDHYDMVFMDLQMPVKDGLTATREWRSLEKTLPLPQRGRLPIIALTANVMAADAQRCLDAGMDGHLPKPVRVDDLRRAVEKWCRRAA